MELFWLLLPVAVACGIMEGKRKGQALKEADEAARRALREEKEAGGRAESSAAVWRVLMDVYTKLRRAGVSLRSPWISGCIAAIEAGRDCPPDVAILALIKTGEDLAGGRWDTDKTAEYFADAAAELSRL